MIYDILLGINAVVMLWFGLGVLLPLGYPKLLKYFPLPWKLVEYLENR